MKAEATAAKPDELELGAVRKRNGYWTATGALKQRGVIIEHYTASDRVLEVAIVKALGIAQKRGVKIAARKRS